MNVTGFTLLTMSITYTITVGKEDAWRAERGGRGRKVETHDNNNVANISTKTLLYSAPVRHFYTVLQ